MKQHIIPSFFKDGMEEKNIFKLTKTFSLSHCGWNTSTINYFLAVHYIFIFIKDLFQLLFTIERRELDYDAFFFSGTLHLMLSIQSTTIISHSDFRCYHLCMLISCLCSAWINPIVEIIFNEVFPCWSPYFLYLFLLFSCFRADSSSRKTKYSSEESRSETYGKLKQPL